MDQSKENILPNVLTLKINIHDRKKVAWVWDGLKGAMEGEKEKAFIAEHGFAVRMVSWGDLSSEKNYVLERIKLYLDRFERVGLLDKLNQTFDHDEPLEQLKELIEIWQEEAYERYGMDVTHEMVQARIKAKQEAKAQRLKEQAGG